MSCKEPPKKKSRQEVSINEILELSSEIITKSHTEQRKIKKDKPTVLVTDTMDPKDVQGDILRETQDLLALIRKSYQKKENDFLNLELSYDESLEKVELCEEMLTEARETLAQRTRPKNI